jgi:hypothetical protein
MLEPHSIRIIWEDDPALLAPRGTPKHGHSPFKNAISLRQRLLNFQCRKTKPTAQRIDTVMKRADTPRKLEKDWEVEVNEVVLERLGSLESAIFKNIISSCLIS